MADAEPQLEDLLAEGGWMLALAETLVPDRAAAEDVVQETWLAAMRRPPDRDRPLRPWLARVIRNFARMRGRSERARAARERDTARAEALPSAAELSARVDVQRMVAEGLLTVEEPFRSTVILRYYQGLSSAEIARRTGTPPGTVRWRLKRGLEALRERLDERCDGDPRTWQLGLALFLRRGWSPPAGAAVGAGAAAGAAKLVGALALVLFLAWLVLPLGPGGASVDRGPAPIAPGIVARTAAAEVASVPAGRRTAGPSAPGAGEEDGARAATASTRLLARVLGADGEPLVGARVRLEAGGAAAADVDGRVELTLEGRSTRTVHVTAPGHVPARLVLRPSLEGVYHLGTVRLEPAGAIEGRVVDARGRPLAGARVRAESLPGRWLGLRFEPLEEARHLGSLLPPDAPSTRTDGDGLFRLPDLPARYTRLWAEADGFVADHGPPVAVLAGQTARAGALVLHAPDPAAVIAGRVVDPDGRPVAFAEVEAGRASKRSRFFAGERWIFRASADAEGRFRLAVDPGQRFELAARDPARSLAPLASDPIAPGVRGVVLHTRPSRALPVVVSGTRPEGDVEVVVLGVDGESELERSRGPDDALSTPVPARPFRVRVEAPGLASALAGPFDPAPCPERIELVLEPVPSVALTVRAAGRPAAGAQVDVLRAVPGGRAYAFPALAPPGWEPLVSLVRVGGRSESRTTDADGRALVPLPRRGTRVVRIELPGFAPSSLLVRAGDKPGERIVELDPGGAIEGRVLGAPSEDVAGRIVGISSGDGYLRTQRVGPDGAFRFDGLGAGPWQLASVVDETAEDGWRVIDAPRVEVVAPAAGDRVTVPPGTVVRVDVALPVARPPLAGRFTVNAAGPGPLQVHARSADGSLASTGLDPGGGFELVGLAPGGASIELWDVAEPDARVTWTVAAAGVDPSEPWRLDVEAGALVFGTGGPWELWAAGPGWSWAASVEHGEAGEAQAFELAQVPAGRVHARGPDGAVRTLSIARGERVVVR